MLKDKKNRGNKGGRENSVFGAFKGVIKGLAAKKNITYEEAKALARDGNTEARLELAARGDVEPEILYFLADDPSPEVRRALAANDALPRHADLLLTGDSDDGVRRGLAAKIARLAPGLSAGERDNIRLMTYEALEILAQDQVTRVRQIIAETLKDVADAPPDVIRRLARDAELVVAGPVLRFSPVLSDEDLLEIIAESPADGGLAAISNRSSVGKDVAGAIVAAGDATAIAVMLANPSAQIREETLDLIIDRAPDEDAWHELLVKRPQLTNAAALRLARFVADSLLENLTRRKDLDEETAEKVREVVRRRLAEEGGADQSAGGGDEGVDYIHGETPLSRARELDAKGALDEKMITEALAKDGEFVQAALAVLAGIKPAVVARAVDSQTAKGIVAVVWKAGLSMDLAIEVQTRVAHIQPRDVLKPRDGEFPLSGEEMDWQLEFLAEL